MENVNHPKHYNLPDRKECIEELRDLYGDEITLTFCLTNAYKYLYRAGQKNNAFDEDVSKAGWYIDYAERKLNPKSANVHNKLFDLYWDVKNKWVYAKYGDNASCETCEFSLTNSHMEPCSGCHGVSNYKKDRLLTQIQRENKNKLFTECADLLCNYTTDEIIKAFATILGK